MATCQENRSVTSYTLHLSEEEAKTLVLILDAVEGNENDSANKFAKGIKNAMIPLRLQLGSLNGTVTGTVTLEKKSHDVVTKK